MPERMAHRFTHLRALERSSVAPLLNVATPTTYLDLHLNKVDEPTEQTTIHQVDTRETAQSYLFYSSVPYPLIFTRVALVVSILVTLRLVVFGSPVTDILVRSYSGGMRFYVIRGQAIEREGRPPRAGRAYERSTGSCYRPRNPFIISLWLLFALRCLCALIYAFPSPCHSSIFLVSFRLPLTPAFFCTSQARYHVPN